MLTAEQLVAAQKANLETLFDLTNKAFEGVEKLVELNLQVAKASLTEVAGHRHRQPRRQGCPGTAGPASRPAATRRREGRRLRPPPVRHRRDHQRRSEPRSPKPSWPRAQANFNGVVDSAVKNAPAGTESAAALVKSAIAAATNAMESVQKATKQAADVAEANFQTLTNTAVKATQTTTKPAKKTAA